MSMVSPVQEWLGHLGEGEAARPFQSWYEQRRWMERQRAHFGVDGVRSNWSSRLMALALTVFGRGAGLLGFYGTGVRNALDLRLEALTLSFSDLPPAFDGYRILHLSDTHLDNLPELAAVATNLTAGIEVDLLVLTGDVHANHHAAIAASVDPLGNLLDTIRVRQRRLAVLGNHDPADMAAALEKIGFDVLANRSTVLEKHGQRLIVTGLDDVHRFFTPEALRAFKEAPDGFRIALVHSAEVADHAATAGYALYLCGHTHGGQICLPGGRAILTGLRRCRFASAGLWRQGNMIGYTSRGLGVGQLPLRFNSRGEITLITLARSGKASS